jgi:hypothetical protein
LIAAKIKERLQVLSGLYPVNLYFRLHYAKIESYCHPGNNYCFAPARLYAIQVPATGNEATGIYGTVYFLDADSAVADFCL